MVSSFNVYNMFLFIYSSPIWRLLQPAQMHNNSIMTLKKKLNTDMPTRWSHIASICHTPVKRKLCAECVGCFRVFYVRVNA